MIVSIVLLPLALLTLVPVMAIRRRDGVSGAAAWTHPESMTAHLAADAEEYLAWLADHHWPDDEYLDLERDWRSDLDPPTARRPPGLPRLPAPGQRRVALP